MLNDTNSETIAKAAVVTGSATGIGSAIVRRLSALGWSVVVNYTRSETEARDTLAACEAAGAQAVLCGGDVANDDDCRRIADAALDAFGRIDALVNNAGTTKFVPADDMASLDATDFARIFSVNVLGAFQMTRAVRPALEASGNGSIVNISSYSGFNGLGSSLAYAASKGAPNTLTKGLAHTLAPRIRVNAVCPGYADTRWGRVGLDDAEYEKFKVTLESNLPLGAMPSADDVAESVVWFLDGGRAVTGQLLVVDSGEHMAGGIAPSDG